MTRVDSFSDCWLNIIELFGDNVVDMVEVNIVFKFLFMLRKGIVMNKKIIYTLLVLFMITGLFTSSKILAEDTDSGIPMYRLYNPNSGEHFYTGNESEKTNIEKVGWRYEGIGWYAPSKGNDVYRLYNPNSGDHHYTLSLEERNQLVTVGWYYEGVGWQSGGDTPLYRLYNPNAVTGTHHYTTSKSESNQLSNIGWQYENIAWYGLTVENDNNIKTNTSEDLDINAIESGDFSSLVGTWVNSEGSTLVFETPGRVINNGSSGSYKVMAKGTSRIPALLAWSDSFSVSGYGIALLKAGFVVSEGDLSDTSRARLVAGQNFGPIDQSNVKYVYYRQK